jgi:hypothetical protein
MAVELAHREVYAPSVNSIVKMPSAMDIGFQYLAAKPVRNNEGRHAALSSSRIVAMRRFHERLLG